MFWAASDDDAGLGAEGGDDPVPVEGASPGVGRESPVRRPARRDPDVRDRIQQLKPFPGGLVGDLGLLPLDFPRRPLLPESGLGSPVQQGHQATSFANPQGQNFPPAEKRIADE